jgi:hypothetical protein
MKKVTILSRDASHSYTQFNGQPFLKMSLGAAGDISTEEF